MSDTTTASLKPVSGESLGPIRVSANRAFLTWLERAKCVLAFTSYKRGRLFLLGLRPDGSLYCHQEGFRRATGLWAAGNDLWLGDVRRLWRLANTAPAGGAVRGFDRLYSPRQSWTIGEIDVHEIGLDGAGRPIFCNTQYSCLATTHPVHGFQPVWKPPFVSDLVPEDRCHLNGVAFEHGKPRFVTALGATDDGEAWRARKADGGVVVDVQADRVAMEGLSMPHSPRIHDGGLWLAQSGRGVITRVDAQSRKAEEVVFLPGFLRGLAFHAGAAITTLSLPRGERTFAGLPLDEALASRGLQPRCGLAVFDQKTGQVLGEVDVEGAEELFDVAVLPGARLAASIPTDPGEDQVAVSFEAKFAAM